MPRPRLLDDVKKRDLCALLYNGCTLAVAAKHVGCSVLTVQREARRCSQFNERIRHAQMSSDLNPLATLRQAAASNWRAAAWMLERTQPEHYARRAANSFSPQDVAELLDRVCQIIGQETRDSQLSARIQRRALAIATSKINHHHENPFRAQLPAPNAAPEPNSSPDPAENRQHPVPGNEDAEAAMEPPATPIDDMQPRVFRASDFQSIPTRPAAAAQAT